MNGSTLHSLLETYIEQQVNARFQARMKELCQRYNLDIECTTVRKYMYNIVLNLLVGAPPVIHDTTSSITASVAPKRRGRKKTKRFFHPEELGEHLYIQAVELEIMGRNYLVDSNGVLYETENLSIIGHLDSDNQVQCF